MTEARRGDMPKDMVEIFQAIRKIATGLDHDDFTKLQFFSKLLYDTQHNLNWAFIWNIYNGKEDIEDLRKQLKEVKDAN